MARSTTRSTESRHGCRRSVSGGTCRYAKVECVFGSGKRAKSGHKTRYRRGGLEKRVGTSRLFPSAGVPRFLLRCSVSSAATANLGKQSDNLARWWCGALERRTRKGRVADFAEASDVVEPLSRCGVARDAHFSACSTTVNKHSRFGKFAERKQTEPLEAEPRRAASTRPTPRAHAGSRSCGANDFWVWQTHWIQTDQ